MNNIIKYEQTYLVYLKNTEIPIEISSNAGEQLKKDINSLTFVNLNWNMYNKFEIIKIEKKTWINTTFEKQKEEKLKRLYWDKWEDYL